MLTVCGSCVFMSIVGWAMYFNGEFGHYELIRRYEIINVQVVLSHKIRQFNIKGFI